MLRIASCKMVLAGLLLVSGIGIGSAFAEQVRMDGALVALTNARAELAKAEPDKGGHRERALVLIDQAIAQVREGIAFAAHH